jgi:hypothetical protein
MVWVFTSICAFISFFTVLAFLLMLPAKKCGGCGEDLPKIRTDISLCPKCGCKVDWQGRKVGPKPKLQDPGSRAVRRSNTNSA